MNTKIIYKIFFTVIFFYILLLIPNYVLADYCYNTNTGSTASYEESECNGRSTSGWTWKTGNPPGYFTTNPNDTSIGEYILKIYNYAIGIVGIVATIVIMFGGFIWITSMGNASRVSSAKEWIGAALTGLALALLSYTIMWIINPDLVTLQPVNPATPEQENSSILAPDGTNYVAGCCQFDNNMCVATDSYSCTNTYNGSVFVAGGTCQNNKCVDTQNSAVSDDKTCDEGNCKAYCKGEKLCDGGYCSNDRCYCSVCPETPGENTACNTDTDCKSQDACTLYCPEASCVSVPNTTSPTGKACKCGDCILH